jgi:hypothetical protein
MNEINKSNSKRESKVFQPKIFAKTVFSSRYIFNLVIENYLYHFIHMMADIFDVRSFGDEP